MGNSSRQIFKRTPCITPNIAAMERMDFDEILINCRIYKLLFILASIVT